MERDELVRRIDGDPILRPHAALLREAIRPALAVGFRSTSRSRFGGAPELPLGTAWPRHRFGPYRFLGQLELSELALLASAMPAPWCSLLPKEGLLSLFVGDDPTGEIDPTGEMFWGDPTYAIAHYAPPGTELAALEPPKEVDFGSATGITLTPELKLPFDRYQVPGWPSAARSRAVFDALNAVREPFGDHLFGWPAHTSLGYDPTPKDMLPLLTLQSHDEREWHWHDGDCLMLFVKPGTVARGWLSLGSDAG